MISSEKESGQQKRDVFGNFVKDPAAVPEDTAGSVAYDTAVEDFIDLLVAVTDGFKLFPPEATVDTKERIFDDAVSCIQSGRE